MRLLCDGDASTPTPDAFVRSRCGLRCYESALPSRQARGHASAAWACAGRWLGSAAEEITQRWRCGGSAAALLDARRRIELRSPPCDGAQRRACGSCCGGAEEWIERHASKARAGPRQVGVFPALQRAQARTPGRMAAARSGTSGSLTSGGVPFPALSGVFRRSVLRARRCVVRACAAAPARAALSADVCLCACAGDAVPGG